MKSTNKYKVILSSIPDGKKEVAKALIEELTFLEATLKNLKTEIKQNGELEHFNQGKQEFMRESPALKAYNASVQRFSVMNRQLVELIDKKAQEQQTQNEVFRFLNDENDD